MKMLTYTGTAQDFPIWSTIFVAMMQTKGVYKSLLGTEEQLNEPAPLAIGASNDFKKDDKVLKDAYQKEVADIKEKRNNLWCHLALTLDATTLMLMRHDCLGDDGIGDGAKAWKLLQEGFQRMEKPTVVTLVAQPASLQLEDAEDLDSFFIRGQELLTRLQEAGEAISETLFNALVLNGLPMRYESFVIQENFNLATNFTELRKRLQNFHESKAQKHKGQSGSVVMAVKRDFKKGPRKGNCFVCGIPGHFAKDCSKLEKVFTDVMGPFRRESLSGIRFCIVFAEQYTTFVFVELLKAKREALSSLKRFVLSVGSPKKLSQDNAKEFLSEQFEMYCLDADIQQEKTIPETPQQKGLAERCNRTLLEMARCLLIDSGLPKMIWGAAILHATRIRNLVFKRGKEKRQAELMRGIKPKLSISKLSIFDCAVFMRKRDRDVSKLEPKALKGKFVGYTKGDNGYLVYVPNTRKVT